ncbi:MAG: dockerin type I repeat-containing protein [Muribaculaceae bacterium]|nr:dockerin type I repeat-containing protein [Muribaculaceae bacterium]
MKHNIIRMAVLLTALLAVTASQADNYFTLGVNDTLRISRDNLGGNCYTSARAHFEGRLNIWFLNLYLPEGITVMAFEEGADMTVSYVDRGGNLSTYSARLLYSDVEGGYGVSTFIDATGYWDYNFDNVLEPYGTLKWESGDYADMVRLTLAIDNSFKGGTATLSGSLTADFDTRGGTINSPGRHVPFSRTVTVVVDSAPGDVNCDGEVNITDAIDLINYLLNDEGDISLDAADMNNDGEVNITDAIDLINYILNN